MNQSTDRLSKPQTSLPTVSLDQSRLMVESLAVDHWEPCASKTFPMRESAGDLPVILCNMLKDVCRSVVANPVEFQPQIK